MAQGRRCADAPPEPLKEPPRSGNATRAHSAATDRPEPLTYEDQLRRNTGWQTPSETWHAAQERRQRMSAQTRRLADALEAEGIPARVLRSDVAIIGEVTGNLAEAVTYR